jgi:hypothetical protein
MSRSLPRSLATLAVAVVVGCGLSGSALAARQAPEQQQTTTLQQALETCRIEGEKAAQGNLESFDVYIDRRGVIQIFGSNWAAFEFKKCMVRSGHPTD